MNILIVDDDRGTLEWYEKNLSRRLAKAAVLQGVRELGAVSVRGANTVALAIQELRDHIYDILVIDLKLPTDSAVEFAGLDIITQSLRLDPCRPVIVLTGYGSVPLVKQTFQQGVFDFIEKSLQSADQLTESILRAIRRRNDGLADHVESIERLCYCFHLVARQLLRRHSNRKTIIVEDEYDVQDLLHAILLSRFKDVRPEEWAPSYAGGAPRMDFLLKPERVVIETKMARKHLNDRKLGEELVVDIARYKAHPDCGALICFVYDPKGVVRNPAGIENDLSGNHTGLPVRVIIAPKGM